ncbi:MAG: orotate phosphoribosyltransferase [Candidatus Delongbacteria bacterium]|nr:orotate phosphoribosyltransferase [bacterium]MBL7033743.1 orotate phosphoribosyltransferase [Candidatus Delongbacteria bacterium]
MSREKSPELEILERSGALLNGHFELTSGRHSDRYFQCALALQYPEFVQALCCRITDEFATEQINCVIAPAVGGIPVTQEVGRLLDIRSLFAERQDGAMTLRRGFKIEPGERVLVVEDVVTTGGSVQEVVQLVQEIGAEVVGVGAIVDRSNGTVDFGVPFFAAYCQEVITWPQVECPLCRKQQPVNKPGSRSL